MTLIFFILLSLLLLFYLAVPLFVPGQSDALPDMHDPVLQDLEEEREALLRAIRELDARDDLAAAKRLELRERYEAKTAKVLRALDEYKQKNGQTAEAVAAAPKRLGAALPLLSLGILALMLAGVGLSVRNLVPEIEAAQDAPATLSEAQFARLEKLVSSRPSAQTLALLADGYWQAQRPQEAKQTYTRMVETLKAPPSLAYLRLGMLELSSDPAKAQAHLATYSQKEPDDPQGSLYLGESYYAQNKLADAIVSWQRYLQTPRGQSDTDTAQRVKLAQKLQGLLQQAKDQPSEANMLKVANTYWQAQDIAHAVDWYLRILQEKNVHSGVALSRVGQALFFSGRNDEAITILERAAQVRPQDLPTLLFLGNAQFTKQNYRAAIATWTRYVDAAGGEAKAGRVPNLIKNAEKLLRESSSQSSNRQAQNAAAARAPTLPLRQAKP